MIRRKFLLVFVCIVACLGAGYIASSKLLFQTVPSFILIQPGKIPNTHYSFVVGPIEYGINGPTTLKLQNNVDLTKFDLVGGYYFGGDLYFEHHLLEYTVLRHQNSDYLILKHSIRNLEISPQIAYFVTNITGDKPYFINSATSCSDPKLLDNRLVFQLFTDCDRDNYGYYDQSVIELR